MSSHHIVREKQEPALLIMGLQGFDSENLGQLLEWSPTVIVDEPLYRQAEALGIKIDAVVTPNSKFNLLHHTHIIETEDAPLEDALKFLIGEQYHSVNVITDRFILKDFALYAEHINLAIFIKNKKIFPIKSGFSKWQVQGKRVELMHDVQNLHTSGLNALSQHIFETKKDGFYSLSFDPPFIFIAEDL